MTDTLNQVPYTDVAIPPATHSPTANSMLCLRESLGGLRTLCLTPMQNESRLGDPVAADPRLGAAAAPLVARFAALIFAEHDKLIEPLLQQLRWVAFEHGIDHIALPLWPETLLAQKLTAIATDLGMPTSFVLMQDETNWPDSHFGITQSGGLKIDALYA